MSDWERQKRFFAALPPAKQQEYYERKLASSRQSMARKRLNLKEAAEGLLMLQTHAPIPAPVSEFPKRARTKKEFTPAFPSHVYATSQPTLAPSYMFPYHTPEQSRAVANFLAQE